LCGRSGGVGACFDLDLDFGFVFGSGLDSGFGLDFKACFGFSSLAAAIAETSSPSFSTALSFSLNELMIASLDSAIQFSRHIEPPAAVGSSRSEELRVILSDFCRGHRVQEILNR
jgi:hypothetical protein